MDLQKCAELTHGSPERLPAGRRLPYGAVVPDNGSSTSELPVSGEFSLRAAAGFGFGPTQGGAPPFDGRLRLAFGVDGGSGYAGAVLTQARDLDGPVSVRLQLAAGADRDALDITRDAALAQVARIVSLDHDGAGFLRVGAADPVLGALQAAHPGQRPVLFHSPYEAAAWAIVSHAGPRHRPRGSGRRWQSDSGARLSSTALCSTPSPSRIGSSTWTPSRASTT